MVHTKCRLKKRGRPTTEFYIDGKPQIYCFGWVDTMTDEPFKICRNCPDWVHGEQCEKDFENAIKNKTISGKPYRGE